jgi:hypothetical protein
MTVCLLWRARNLPIKQVAPLGKVSVPRISEIQGQIKDLRSLGHVFQWAGKLGKYKKGQPQNPPYMPQLILAKLQHFISITPVLTHKAPVVVWGCFSSISFDSHLQYGRLFW